MINQVNKTINRKRKVLVVDDEIVNRQLLGFILETHYEVLYAENGQVALDIVSRERESISVILLDLRMPVMDGLTLLNILKADSELSAIPVIVLTSETKYEVDSLKMGAIDFIKKPYDLPEIILARVQRIIELTEDKRIIGIAEHDDTGLYTKNFFLEYMRQIDQFKGEKSMDTIALDIDHFHLINEIYGREFGDLVLVKIGERIKGLLEEHSGIGCHWDVDQFYIYCEHLESDDALRKLIDDIGDFSKSARVRMRAGIFHESDMGPEERSNRLSGARFACNTLRNSYTKSIAVYDSKLHDNEVFNERLINDMQTGIDEHQFKVFFQPKYDITGDRPVMCAAEALVRWQHPEFGLLSPGRFIPAFESNGLLHRLYRAVWEEAAIRVSRWKKELGVEMTVSVNVSRIDLYDADTLEFILDLIKKYDISPEMFHLEITESAYIDDTAEMLSTIRSLQEAGLYIEMDDFGAGFSSLNMLTDMPIDCLKLDVLFARSIDRDERKFRLVEMLISLAKYLGLPVIAEGVEEKEQYERLKSAGCDMVQGYYFSKPVPEEEFIRLMIEGGR